MGIAFLLAVADESDVVGERLLAESFMLIDQRARFSRRIGVLGGQLDLREISVGATPQAIELLDRSVFLAQVLSTDVRRSRAALDGNGRRCGIPGR